MKREKKKFVCTTAYDSSTALYADRAGVDLILCGDSAAHVKLGYKSTLPVTMNYMIEISRSVWRGNKSAFFLGDMPFASYQISDEEAVRNACRFHSEGGVDGVKMEGTQISRAKAIVDAGLIVCSHIGLSPQSRSLMGGFVIQGRTKAAADVLLEDALRLQDAGVRLLLLEAVPAEVGQLITEKLSIPTVGVGAGPYTDGQLVISDDMLGLFPDFKPKFAKQYIDGASLFTEAFTSYVNDVRSGAFPGPENCYQIKQESTEGDLSGKLWKYEAKN